VPLDRFAAGLDSGREGLEGANGTALRASSWRASGTSGSTEGLCLSNLGGALAVAAPARRPETAKSGASEAGIPVMLDYTALTVEIADRSEEADQEQRLSSDQFVLIQLHQEASNHRDRRHRFENAKLFTVTAILGLGGLKLWFAQDQNPLALTSTLFFAPFLAAIFDLFIFAEDYKVHRILAFTRHYVRRLESLAEFGDRGGLLRSWVNWRSTYTKGESDARYYGSAIASLVTVIPAVVAYFQYYGDLTGAHPLLFLMWFLSALYAIVFVFSIAKSRYNEMVDSPEKIMCPLGKLYNKMASNRKAKRGPYLVFVIPDYDGDSDKENDERTTVLVRTATRRCKARNQMRSYL
jgi:hypothetical protein